MTIIHNLNDICEVKAQVEGSLRKMNEKNQGFITFQVMAGVGEEMKDRASI